MKRTLRRPSSDTSSPTARFHPQFRCTNCKKSPTEVLSWLNRKQRQTNRYQEYIYERVKELTVKQVSENEKMSVAGHPRRSEDAVQDIFHKVAKLKKKRMRARLCSPTV